MLHAMSRIFQKNSRGRQPALPVPKMAKSKAFLDDTYQDTNNKRHKPGRNYATSVQQAKKRRRAPSTPSESSASSSDAEDEASEGDDESEDDEPLARAPSLSTLAGEAGRSFRRNEFDDGVSDAGTVESMFDSNFQFADGGPDLFPLEDIKNKVFPDSDDDNDDEAYKAVDDISDSDDEDVEAYEEQQLLAMLSDNEMGEGEFLNQIDGLSEYGFGNESDGTAQFPPSSQGSDTEPVHQRHVRFDVDTAQALHAALSSSPTISRALLPSALPEHGGIFGGPASASTHAPDEPRSEDEYDSDATDDDLPAAAVQQAATGLAQTAVDVKRENEEPAAMPKPTQKKTQRKGPPRGIFIDEGTKASGILDPTGKIMLITHPHLLGEEFARRYGNSAPASPSLGFQELIDGSEAGDSQSVGDVAAAAEADPLLGALTTQVTDPGNVGQPFGPQEAFYPAPGFDLGDYMFDGEDFEDDPLGEENIHIEDVIKFDDSDDSDEPTSPIYMPPRNELPSAMASFGNANVTAFRNNADQNFTAFGSSHFTQLAELSTPMRRGGRKRKAIDSPYSSSHYAGVTPIQRMRDPNPPSTPATPDSTVRPKRRRLMTA